MLILTRKKDEEIIINSNIMLTIISTSDNQVKIGISAPDDVQIFRGELYEKIKETTIEASNMSKEKIGGLNKLKINKIEK